MRQHNGQVGQREKRKRGRDGEREAERRGEEDFADRGPSGEPEPHRETKGPAQS